jgi:hypothetical protein
MKHLGIWDISYRITIACDVLLDLHVVNYSKNDGFHGSEGKHERRV